MKVLKRLSDDEFIVKVEDSDIDIKSKVIAVNHDYMNVCGRILLGEDYEQGERFCGTDMTIHGKKVQGVPMFASIHINIRDMIDLVMPYLNRHPYLKREHLLREGKNEAYLYYSSDIILHDAHRVEKIGDDVIEHGTTRHYTRPSSYAKDRDAKVYHVEQTDKEWNLSIKYDEPGHEKKLVSEYDVTIDEINRED